MVVYIISHSLGEFNGEFCAKGNKENKEKQTISRWSAFYLGIMIFFLGKLVYRYIEILTEL
jgi:hypothetical protein